MSDSATGSATGRVCSGAWDSFPYATTVGGTPSSVASYSHFNDPLPGSSPELRGRSRRWGDVPIDVQQTVADRILVGAEEKGFTLDDQAAILATVALESGFNPDAAAGTTSASGLAQMIDATGAAYGIDDTNRFSADAQIPALLKFFAFNKKLAARLEGQGVENPDNELLYALHHDGPTLSYGGRDIARNSYIPLREKFAAWLSAKGASCAAADKK